MKPIKKNNPPTPVWKNPAHFLACGLGSGASPWAPGTAGTIMAIPFYLAMSYLTLSSYMAVVLAVFLMGVWVCDKTSKDWGVHDHGSIVIDEFVGFWITMIGAPLGIIPIVLGFFIFRFFDVIKPWPIGWVDRRVHGGLGIMLDDVLAGIYSSFVLQMVIYYLH